jgi:methyl-accepting chemotaxis protein
MLIFITSIGYITLKSRELALNEAREIANKNAREYANIIKSELTSDLNITKTLAQTAQAYMSTNWENWNKVFLEQQQNVINENPHFLAVATSWELSQIESDWNKPFGRYLNGWVKNQDGHVNHIETRLNTDGDDLMGNYYYMKTTGKSLIVDPKLYSPTGKIEDQYINSNISVPIKLGNTFIGLAGVDVDLNRFQDIIVKIKPFKDSYSFLISNDGTFVAHPNVELMGKFISDVYPELNEEFGIDEKIEVGENFSFTYKKIDNQKDFYVFASINVEGIDTPWSLAICVPNKVITEKAKVVLYNALLVCFIGLILLTIVIWIIAKNIADPVKKVTSILKELANGKIDSSLLAEVKSKDEVGEMTHALNTSINGLNKKAEFANLIGSGEIDTELELLSKNDILGKSLINMRESLKKSRNEEELRKIEDQKRRWSNEGLAKFSEILRKDNDNIDTLAREIIKNLVYYLNSNQGGLFIIDEDNRTSSTLQLLSAFAFDREKFMQKEIEIGEGLVGTCAAEKETIYLTEIPQDYVQITSGLGDANPNSLLLVPMIIENDLLGVIEIASFSKFEPHEVEFAEKIAESIAATLKSVRINIKTSHLLEQSQQQSEEMAAQEEEMRQNLEELQATQEESTRKGSELNGTLDAIDSFLLKTEFDLNFNVINANEQFLTKFGYNLNEAIGMDAENFVAKKNLQKFQLIINKVLGGKSHQEISFLQTKSGDELKLITSFTPVFIDERIDKILLLSVDINDFK